jgi:hypothetical protein
MTRTPSDARAEKLAAALRANLARRKALARGVGSEDAERVLRSTPVKPKQRD